MMLFNQYTGMAFVLGLCNGVMPGPLSAFIISEALNKDLKSSLKIALTPLTFGLFIVPIIFLIAKHIADFHFVIALISFLGGIYLTFLSAHILFQKNHLQSTTRKITFRQAALVNFSNPYGYIFWFTVGLPLIHQRRLFGVWAAIIVMVVYYLMLVGSKIILALMAYYLGYRMRGRAYVFIMKTLGLSLLIFAFTFLKTFFMYVVHALA